jgi:hypothetical protein
VKALILREKAVLMASTHLEQPACVIFRLAHFFFFPSAMRVTTCFSVSSVASSNALCA